MLVRFLEREINAIENWDAIYSISQYDVLSRGKAYTVYGISIHGDVIKYEILFDVDTYPKTFSSHLFEVLDNRLSRYFCFGKSVTGNNDEIIFISFKESVGIRNRFFYYKLVEGEPEEVRLFEYYKSVMELEYRNPEIEAAALLMEGDFLQCSVCENIWEEERHDFEMCKCNVCDTILLNPLSR